MATAPYQGPRRAISSPFTLTSISSSASTVLSTAAAAAIALGSDKYYAFKGGKSGTTTPGSLDYLQIHPVSGANIDPTQSGREQVVGQTAIDWATCGVYDDGNGDNSKRRVMWIGSGANTAISGGYVYNTRPVYDETTDFWTVDRGFRGPNTTTSETGVAHLYGTNTINKATRELCKFDINYGLLRWNLDTNTLGNRTNPSFINNVAAAAEGGMEFIPPRNRVWVRMLRSANNFPMVWEFNDAMTQANQIFASDTQFSASGSARSPIIWNPRAFGNKGGVFIGGADCVTIELGATNASNILHYNTPTPSGTTFYFPNRAHVCRDPIGDGWLYMDPDTGRMWKMNSGAAGAGNSGTWTQLGLLPQLIRDRWTTGGTFNYVVIPLDVYGVIWIIGNAANPDRAWLYRP